MLKIVIVIEEAPTMEDQTTLEAVEEIVRSVGRSILDGERTGTCYNFYDRRCGVWHVEGEVDNG